MGVIPDRWPLRPRKKDIHEDQPRTDSCRPYQTEHHKAHGKYTNMSKETRNVTIQSKGTCVFKGHKTGNQKDKTSEEDNRIIETRKAER